MGGLKNVLSILGLGSMMGPPPMQAPIIEPDWFGNMEKGNTICPYNSQLTTPQRKHRNKHRRMFKRSRIANRCNAKN